MSQESRARRVDRGHEQTKSEKDYFCSVMDDFTRTLLYVSVHQRAEHGYQQPRLGHELRHEFHEVHLVFHSVKKDVHVQRTGTGQKQPKLENDPSFLVTNFSACTLFFCCWRVTSELILEAIFPMVFKLSSTLQCVLLSIGVWRRIVSSSSRYRGIL